MHGPRQLAGLLHFGEGRIAGRQARPEGPSGGAAQPSQRSRFRSARKSLACTAPTEAAAQPSQSPSARGCGESERVSAVGRQPKPPRSHPSPPPAPDLSVGWKSHACGAPAKAALQLSAARKVAGLGLGSEGQGRRGWHGGWSVAMRLGDRRVVYNRCGAVGSGLAGGGDTPSRMPRAGVGVMMRRRDNSSLKSAAV